MACAALRRWLGAPRWAEVRGGDGGVCWATQPLRLAAKALGLAPFALDAEGRARPDRLALLWSVLLFAGTLAVNVGKHWQLLAPLTEPLNVSDVAAALSEVAFYATYCVSVATMLKWRHLLAAAAARVQHLHRLLPQPPTVYTWWRRANVIQLCVVVLVALCTSSAAMTLSASRPRSRPHYLVLLLHNAQTWLVEVMFANLVAAVLLALRRLNAQVLALARAQPRARPEDVLKLRTMQACVCDAALAVNAAFSPAMLTSAVRSFVVLTSSLFLLLGRALTGRRGRRGWALGARRVPLHAMYCLEAAARLVTVAAACALASKQSQHTGTVIHKVLIDIQDPDLRYELQLMSLQLLHRQVQFTACDFFVIDFTLLYSIVGSVTTYLVILLQFQLSSEGTSRINNQMSPGSPVTSSSPRSLMHYAVQFSLPPGAHRNISIFHSHN